MKKLFKLTILVTILLSSMNIARADEGMWLPSVISHSRLKDMQEKGFKLNAEDIYSINKASLKDAIVNLNGCTGEIISNKGLLLTNHHCGYDQLQLHSTIEHDYLTNGFSALNLDEELPTNQYSASFLKKMEDVTKEVMKGITSKTSIANAEKIKKANIKKIIDSATKNSKLKATIEAMYYTNQYFLFTYEQYLDVRLVVAPPSAIGKFGGDVDNWMWPRHTGDFMMFRIYADKDNKPAKYSKENVPYTPAQSLKISLKGVKEGDFTFIYGYPGRTSEYLHSAAVKYIIEKSNPHKISLRDYRLNVMNEAMKINPATRIKYSVKNAYIANAWKKWQGETRGVITLKAIENKESYEAQFIEWAKDKPQYANIVQQFQANYDELEKYAFAFDYYREAFMGMEFIGLASEYSSLNEKSLSKNRDKLKNNSEIFFRNYDVSIDIAIAKEMMNRYISNVELEFIPEILLANKNNLDEFIEDIFNNSIFTNENKFCEAMRKTPKEFMQIIAKDPAILLQKSFAKMRKEKIAPQYTKLNQQITALYKDYMKGMMEMEPNREFYPDANSTLRIAYGKVSSANPKDGVIYKHYSTLEGIMEKDNPMVYDYNTPQILRDIYKAKDYGIWEENGTVPVCFIASNHTTGGNSGSPILNGNGELIGLNFDRMWESTMSDIVFSEQMCRNIAVDIRYVLFLVDKVCGAGYLIEEMDLVGSSKKDSMQKAK